MLGSFYLFLLSCVFMMIMVISICLQNKHILSILLSLEGIMLSLYIMLILFLCLNNYLLLVFLSLVACEASIGLSLMVKFVRSHGNDYVYMMNLNKF
uniref:NADH-ubiquinone oxidoreductase chain 4L n=1 Tax=Graptacme eborea TaxID=55752 RepID=Q68SP6_GRAEB|nr:NADH dehydrogenase subunit 4L [Graptacme eborea]AAT98400.1 NADH dehydrogenase subunit 4L [Graptacme eborea]